MQVLKSKSFLLFLHLVILQLPPFKLITKHSNMCSQVSKKIKIILTDDDKEEHSLFQDAMAGLKMSHSLQFFSNGKELIDYFNSEDAEIPHILFLDLNMPIMSGMDCLKYLRSDERFKDLPIAIYSTSSTEKDIEDTFVLGANVYLTKPDNFNKMKEGLNTVMRILWEHQSKKMDMTTFLISI